MDNYLSIDGMQSGTQNQPGFDIDKGMFGEIEWDLIIDLMVESKKSVMFAIGRGGSVSTSVLIHSGKVFFGSCDCRFYALNLDDGSELWHVKTNDIILSSPCIFNDTIYFGSHDRNLYAVSLDGELKWNYPANSSIGAQSICDKNGVYFATKDGILFHINHEGKLVWSFPAGDTVSNGLCQTNEFVLFGSWDKKLYCVRKSDGGLKWSCPTGGLIDMEFCVNDDIAYFGSFDNKIYAILVSNGQKLWDFSADNVIRNVAFYRGMIFASARDSRFYCISTDGQLLWKFSASKPFSSRPPEFFNDTIFLPCHDGILYALDLNGNVVWKYITDSAPIASGPAIDPDSKRLCFGDWKCNLHCINSETGEFIWKFATSLSYAAPVDMESVMGHGISHTISMALENEEPKKETEEAQLHDYGEMSGAYIDTSKTDYMGHMKKGYVKKGD